MDAATITTEAGTAVVTGKNGSASRGIGSPCDL